MSAETLYKRLLFSLGLFFFIFILGALGYWGIGLFFADASTHEDPYGFSFLNALYMAAITVTTVGYTEATNYHNLGASGEKIGVVFTTFYVIIAYLSVIYASANIVAALVEGAVGKIWLRRKMEKLLKEIEGHHIVCGAGSTGRYIIDELLKTGHKVVAVDRHEETLKEFESTESVVILSGDITDDELLERVGLKRATGIFCALPDDKDNLFIALTARQVNPKVRIVSRATTLATTSKLKAVGANAVISPNQIGGLRMASEMIRPSVVSFLDTMLRQSDANMRFGEVPVHKGDYAADKTLREINALKAVGLSIIGIFRENRTIVYNPQDGDKVMAGDSLIVISDSKKLQKLKEHVHRGA